MLEVVAAEGWLFVQGITLFCEEVVEYIWDKAGKDVNLVVAAHL